MTPDATRLKLRALLDQGLRQGRGLNAAKQAIERTGAPSIEMVSAPTEEQAVRIDVFLFRYMRCQDLIGGRLFPALLEAGAEITIESAYIDKLSKLEQLGIIDSVDSWMEMRALRNQLAHDYPDPDIRLDILRNALGTVPTLLTALRAADDFARTKLAV